MVYNRKGIRRYNKKKPETYGQKLLRYHRIYKRYAPIAATAYSAYKTARKVQRMINPELKFYDTQHNVSSIGYIPTMYCTTNPEQGVTTVTRIGISLKADSIYINYNILRKATATNVCDRVRLIVYIDTMQDENSQNPQISDVLSDVTLPYIVNSPLKIRRAGRFTILHDRVYILNDIKPNANGKIYRKLNHHVKFVDDGTTAAYLNQGHIWYCVICDSNAAEINPSALVQTRFRYYDN